MSTIAELLAPERKSGPTEIAVEYASDLPQVAVLIIDRPHAKNALTLAMWQQIPILLSALSEDTVAVVVRGGGASALSSGADITEFPRTRTDPRHALTYSAAIGAAIDALRALPSPVVAMIHGLAVGGGCEIAAACDVRIASTNARLGLPIGKLGVTLGVSEARALVDLIGPSRTLHLVLSGSLLGPDQALAVGLVDEVVGEADCSGRVEEFVRGIASASQPAVRSAKRALRTAAAGTSRAYAEAFAAELLEVYPGDDFREGITAFVEKRPPTFRTPAGE